MNIERVNEMIDGYGTERMNVLAILQDIQREYNFLPREAMELTAERLDMPISEVYRLATFFTAFSLTPKGEHICKVCMGTACHVLGGPRILDAMERKLGIQSGQTTPNGKFSLEAVRCLGACALGPLVVIDDVPHGYVKPDKAGELVDKVQETGGETPPQAEPQPASTRRAVDLSAVPPAG